MTHRILIPSQMLANGLTVREHFAVEALKGLLACGPQIGATANGVSQETFAAKRAVIYADRLILELQLNGQS